MYLVHYTNKCSTHKEYFKNLDVAIHVCKILIANNCIVSLYDCTQCIDIAI